MQPWFSFLPIFLVLFVVFMQQRQEEERRYILKIKRRKRGDTEEMNELIKGFVGKECLIYAGSSSQIKGVVTGIEGNWISVNNGVNTELVNVDYVSRIREYPKNKKGKNKQVVLD